MITSQACNWLCSHAWPYLICAYPSVSNTFNLITTFVQGLAGDTSQSDHLIEIAASHCSDS